MDEILAAEWLDDGYYYDADLDDIANEWPRGDVPGKEGDEEIVARFFAYAFAARAAADEEA